LVLGDTGCSRGVEPDQHPMRSKVVGHWLAGRPNTTAPMATLDLNDDGTFQYEYDAHSKPAIKLSGVWTIDDDAIVGQINAAENSEYKAGNTFPFGKVATANDTVLILQRPHDITDQYQRTPAPAADGAKK
jgi:hypothetical protein